SSRRVARKFRTPEASCASIDAAGTVRSYSNRRPRSHEPDDASAPANHSPFARARGGGDRMNCEELRDYYGKYACGAAGEPERGEIRAHLDRGCEVCIAGVKRAVEMAAAPPKAPRRFGWAPFWAAAAVLSLAAAVYFSGRERQFAEDAQRLQRRLR